MNAAEYLARVGFDYLIARAGGPTRSEWADEDDRDALDTVSETARLADHQRVRDILTDPEQVPQQRANALNGARWIDLVLSWPDRVPRLKPWAGRSTLSQIITQRRSALLRAESGIDLLKWITFPKPATTVKKTKACAKNNEPPKTSLAMMRVFFGTTNEPEDLREGIGHSGIDSYPCVNSRDAGFSPYETGIMVAYRPAVELLAIIGIETVPLVNFGKRDCGFVHAGKVWRFPIEDRDGDRKRWGNLTQHKSEGEFCQL